MLLARFLGYRSKIESVCKAKVWILVRKDTAVGVRSEERTPVLPCKMVEYGIVEGNEFDSGGGVRYSTHR